MLWARLLAYVTGTVNQELLLRNGDSPSEPGGIHAVPGPGLDGTAGSKPDHAAVGMPERLPLASKKPESELVCRMLGEISQRRMPGKAHPGWRVIAAASLAAIFAALP